MIHEIIAKILGTKSERYLKSILSEVNKINKLESKFEKLTREELQDHTNLLKERYKNGESLEALLPEAFALVREAAKQTIGKRHYDVQLKGGLVLFSGRIAEMRTGEGKTLVATLPAFLHALTGKGVHVVTVNDYLAKRDATEMGKIFRHLGLTCGYVTENSSHQEKVNAYDSDILYCSNHQLVFDYLRDRMVMRKEEVLLKRPLYFVLLDEVDNILIDEARTPLIISAPSGASEDYYKLVNELIKFLNPEDYEIDKKNNNVSLTDRGSQKVEDLALEMGIINGNLYEEKNLDFWHYINNALKATHIMQRNVDYIVMDDEIVIVDPNTGRLSQGRRYSEGLHQALEAKENLEIKPESQTLCSISYTNYFRMYEVMCGMTGTASAEAHEFSEIYKLEVITIPTHRPIRRIDHEPIIFWNRQDQLKYLLQLVEKKHAIGQPILIGTTSVEDSELVSYFLEQYKIKHEVLNAKNHAREAEIIADSGKKSHVTVATNMAGRGTDIKLGGNVDILIEKALLRMLNKRRRSEIPEEEEMVEITHADLLDYHFDEMEIDNETRLEINLILEEYNKRKEEVLNIGGLCVVIFGVPESAKIVDQFKGRCGRNGDKGESYCIYSYEDSFIAMIMTGAPSLVASLATKKNNSDHGQTGIEKSILYIQHINESRYFNMRHNLLKYDEVKNEQQKEIYAMRDFFLDQENLLPIIKSGFNIFLQEAFDYFTPAHKPKREWKLENLIITLNDIVQKMFDFSTLQEVQEMKNKFKELFNEQLVIVEGLSEDKNDILRYSALQSLDNNWRNYLNILGNIRQEVNLRSYAQKNPLHEYKIESVNAFKETKLFFWKDFLKSFFNLVPNFHISSFLQEFESKYGDENLSDE